MKTTTQTQPTTHTPGPWHPQHQDYADAAAFEIRTGREKGHYDDEPGALVATVPFTRFRSTAEANARLIASAPALLSDLEDLVECMGHYLPFEHPALVNARASIAKAKGQS